MSNAKITYKEVAKAKVSETRNVVVSECSKGGFTIAQQLEQVERGKKIHVFLKGAIHIDNADGLLELRDAVNMALSRSLKNENGWYEN